MIDEKDRERHMKQLKRRMDNWRDIILPLNSILMWDKSWYPGLILGITTKIFLIIWMSEPAFLTVVSITLLILALIDYLVPILTSTFVSSNDWNGKKERKLEDICQNLSSWILQIQDFWTLLLKARNDRPTIYYGSLTLGLSLFAWFGNIVNNLLLFYLILNTILLLPGLKHKGRAQKIFMEVYKHFIHPKKS